MHDAPVGDHVQHDSTSGESCKEVEELARLVRKLQSHEILRIYLGDGLTDILEVLVGVDPAWYCESVIFLKNGTPDTGFYVNLRGQSE